MLNENSESETEIVSGTEPLIQPLALSQNNPTLGSMATIINGKKKFLGLIIYRMLLFKKHNRRPYKATIGEHHG